MTREEYEKLKRSGMMWELHPEFTGNYESDVLTEKSKLIKMTKDTNSLSPLVRRELIHRWNSTTEEFLAEIEKTGGWPQGYTHVSFFHDGPDGDRYCKFTTHVLRTGWWTTVATSDDYYYWKLSDAKREEILKQAKMHLIKQLR